MKYLLVLILVTLISCGKSSTTNQNVATVAPVEPSKTYLITGQSNALRCDWSYFTHTYGHDVYMIAEGGAPIKRLINNYNGLSGEFAGIFFIHGESDAGNKKDPNVYVSQSINYFSKIYSDIGTVPVYISTVGYHKKAQPEHYDALRIAMNEEAEINDLWTIAFDDAQSFPDRDMLTDNVHFTPEGCREMMDNFAVSIR